MAVPLAPPSVSSGSSESDPDREALASIDAVYHSDPAVINEQVARLRRLVRIRRPLYYSVLAPAAFASRLSPLFVLLSGVLASMVALVALAQGQSPLVTFPLMYWAVASLAYHALSVRMAALMDDAATSVGWKAADVLAKWKS